LGNKAYVVDTNAILEDPYIVNKLDGKIIIPTTVLMELDDKKFGNMEKNRNAREFARLLDKEYEKFSYHQSHEYEGTNDQKIINAARSVRKEGLDVILISNDIYMSILAKTYGIDVQRTDRKGLISHVDASYSGIHDIKSIVDQEYLSNYKPEFPNQYVVKKNGIFRYQKDKPKRLGKDTDVWGIKHLNLEQKCAIDALMDDDIKLVTLKGKAGSGKTLLSIAAGLEKTISENKYQKLLVSRPIIPMGNDIGFLPGDISEKLGPWMQPIFDNIDFLFNNKGKRVNDCWMELEKEGLLKLEALTYIRGRSIPDQFILIDEAQNLSKHEIKTILSRAGKGTKIVLTGDPDQIDNPKLDSVNNGLSYVIERFKNQKIAAHITLARCERSELADIAAEIL